jgi:hypothetical protein
MTGSKQRHGNLQDRKEWLHISDYKCLNKLGLIEMIARSLTDLGIVAITEQRHPRDDNV